MAIKPKGKKVTGTKKNDKITWSSTKPWKTNLTVTAGSGNDVINFKKSNYNNTIKGENGNDKIYGGKKVDKIYGGKGNDKLYGYAGNDIIKAGAGKDYIDGGAGNDKLYGESGTNTLKGGAGNDKIYGGTGTDNIWGGAGNDIIDLAKGGKNTVYAEAGADKILNIKGNSVVDGGANNDTITAVSGNNTLKGGAGNDQITGGSGNDVIYGGAGNDIINAGKGKNQIVFNKGDGVDTIYAGGGIDTLVFNDEHLNDSDFPISLYAMFDEHNENDLILYHNDGSDKYTWAILKDYGTGEHSSQWLNLDGKNIRTDRLIKKNNMSTDPSFGDHNIYSGTSRPDILDISSDTSIPINAPIIDAGAGDDKINIGNTVNFILDTGKGNDYIDLINQPCSGTIHLIAGNGDDTLNGLWNTHERQSIILDPITYDEHGNPVGDDSLLVRRNGNFSYILGEHSGEDFEDLTIKLTNGETFTVYEYFNSHVNSDLLTFKGIDSDGHTFEERVSSYLVTEVPTVAELSSSKTDYTDLSAGMHVVTANDSGEYHIKLGDSNNNVISVNNGESYNIELGNGSGSEIVVGDYFADEPLEAYAEVKVGNGDKNSIALFKTGSYTGVTVGDGNGNSVYIDAPMGADEPIDTYAHIDVGHGDGNSIDVNNNGQTVIQIGNGDDNCIYSNGAGYTNINSSVGSEEFYYGENTDKIGSCYMSVGYNSGNTISTTQITSFGNDTIKGVGTVNVNIDNPTTTTKVIQTNFAERDVETKSQTIVNLGNGRTANIHIELQPKSEIGYYTRYFSLLPALGAVGSSYNFVYGAFDMDGNYVDGEIVISDAYVQSGPIGSGPGGSTPFNFRFDTENLFSISGVDDYTWGIGNEIQLYDMERVNSHNFNQQIDIVYNGGAKLLINGTSENDRIDVYGGATVNAKGGINNIVSQGDNTINVTGTDNIYVTDYEDEDENIVPTHHTINVSTTGHANISGIEYATSTLIKYDKSVKNVMFSYYGDSEETFMFGTPNYLTIHSFDADGNMINSDKIYGHLNGTLLSFDDIDEYGNVIIDNHLTVMYNKDVERKLSEMTQYIDMAVIDDVFDVYSYGGTSYIGKGYYVQGTQDNDRYLWEFAGNVTINEKGGDDTLTIYADDGILRGARNTKFIFDVSVTRDAETSEITGVTMGDDIIFVSDFNSGGEIENFFSTSASTRDSVTTLTVKDFFKSDGANMDNIKLEYYMDKHYYDIFNYDALMDDNKILAEVTAWLGENTEYSSVMDAINHCGDQDKLDALCACYSKEHNFEYWTQQEVV